MASGAVRRVWEKSRAKNGALLVLLAIAFDSEKESEVEMSVAELARKARISERTARSGVRELEAIGELSVTPVKGGRSRYAVTLDPGNICRGTPADSAAPPADIAAPTPADIAGAVDNTPADIAAPQTGTSQVSTPTPAESAGVGPVDNFSDVLSTTTGRSLVAVKDVPAKPPRGDERPDVDRLCEHLARRIIANGNRTPTITRKWRDAARLLMDGDGITEEQAHAAIDWCQDSEFWRANILSMPKLREKYDQLRQQARRAQQRPDGNQNLGYVADYLKRNGVDI